MDIFGISFTISGFAALSKPNAIDKFILERGQGVKHSALSKDTRNLKAFINWCRENRYINGEIRDKVFPSGGWL